MPPKFEIKEKKTFSVAYHVVQQIQGTDMF